MNPRRCEACIGFRLDRTFAFAKANSFDWVATTLSVSRRKKTEQINAVGQMLSEKYGLCFLERDWKKNRGEMVSQERARDAGIYRQNYCGCVYSFKKKDSHK